jgi:hypothetical protein
VGHPDFHDFLMEAYLLMPKNSIFTLLYQQLTRIWAKSARPMANEIASILSDV